jgi:hypothetical protein
MKLKVKIPRISGKKYLVIFGLLLAGAAYIRFWAAPISSGVDVPQFWAFARVFRSFGLDFYRYADASLNIFPNAGWGFVYPPVWLLILRLALIATPAAVATETMVSESWRVAVKTPIIAADLAIGCLLYWAVPGPKWLKLVIAALWLFHPTAWYESAVFGQFDAIAAVLLLAAVILMERGKDVPAFLLAGLALMTKQHVFFPVLMMLAVSARHRNWRRLGKNAGILAAIGIVFSVPFLVTGNFTDYARAIFLPGQAPAYQNPVMYAFNGFGALLTFLHNSLGWETSPYFIYLVPVLVPAVIAAAVFCYRSSITPLQAALAGFLVFISFMYRVNYQYLIVYIPLALLAASVTKYRSERIMALVLALLPAAWPWLFDISFWFNYLKPTAPQATALLERLGLTHLGMPDYSYVALALALTCLFIAHTVITFTRWRKPLSNKNTA